MTSESPFDRVARLARGLPYVEHSTAYGTPSLKVKGKSFARIKEKMDGVLVVMVPLGLKEVLMEVEPDKYFETPHYAGYPAMLVRLAEVSDAELAVRLECAWLEKAPRKCVVQYSEDLNHGQYHLSLQGMPISPFSVRVPTQRSGSTAAHRSPGWTSSRVKRGVRNCSG